MADAEHMIELLRYASQSKVAAALGVSKTTTGQWARGRDVTPYRLRQVRDLLRPPEAEPPAPVWVERVLASLMVREDRDGVTDEELAAAQIRAAAALAVAQQARPRRGGDDGGGAAGA